MPHGYLESAWKHVRVQTGHLESMSWGLVVILAILEVTLGSSDP